MPKRTAKNDNRLSDTQLVILSTAAQHDDLRVYPLPDTLRTKGAALTRTIHALIRKELILEKPASAEDVRWRNDENGQPVTLVLSKAALDLLGIENAADETIIKGSKQTGSTSQSVRVNTKGGKKRPAKNVKQARETKSAMIQRLLCRKHGASISDLANATGWQAHSIRGFLSGTLKRKQGLTIISDKTDKGTRLYRIAS